MKKIGRVEIRVEPAAWDSFETACDTHGVSKAAIIRDLCAAAIPYMAEHCPAGRWIAPTLVPYGAGPKAEVLQVHNGKGHQRATVRRKA